MIDLTIAPDSTRSDFPGFTSAFRGELTLTRRRAAVWISIGVWAACIAVFAYLVAYISTASAAWYTAEQQHLIVSTMLPQAVPYYILASLPLYGAPQLAILGAVLGASDYVRGTIQTITARFPGRSPLIAARVVNLVLIAGIAAGVTLLTSILSSLVVAIVSGRAGILPSAVELALTGMAIWLVAITFVSFGFAIGTLTRCTIAAAIIAVTWVLGVESLLVGMLAPAISVLQNMQGLLPVGAASSLAAAFTPEDVQTIPATIATTTPAIAVVVLTIWAVASFTAASLALRKRDLA